MNIKKINISNLGPLTNAEIELGDLTVFVGPQAVGKTLLLQFINLIMDYQYIKRTLKNYSYSWDDDNNDFLDAYLGEGMKKIWREDSKIDVNGKTFDWKEQISKQNRNINSRVFFIPAQRFIIIEEGSPKKFDNFSVEYPFIIKDFSERIRKIIESGLGSGKSLFPQANRLKKQIRDSLSNNIFNGAELSFEKRGLKKKLQLKVNGASISIMDWSTGQREFTPLLLGLYYLTPAGKGPKVADIDWVFIEELEMGLHPKGIQSVILSVMELISRGYKVILSTHSPQVLDFIWAMNYLKTDNRKDLFKDLFNLKENDFNMAENCLNKTYKVYYFNQDNKDNTVKTEDISSLDPWSDNPSVSGWGGLTGYSDTVHNVIMKTVRD